MSIEDKIREIRKRLRKILPSWVNFQNFIFITVILAFVSIVMWSESWARNLESRGVATVTPTLISGNPTPLSPELIASPEQTNGILLGAIVILFAVVVGTLVMVLRDITK
ncbi:hypothetical protein [Pelolinea submarina]|uniref:Uncharacterized protein n=1 Tax=Pelolinea submarina TaxID=913107 RepID=A0A347ZRB1_9CHLR|nr:hypothetical protein [Pelolinea submarina]REG11602.1 hypothetical protein DFR64_1494 [Pelolinea submarina]BBB47842.1 hypothetical protein Pelsub_P1070 [Pelolinea submarina]